MNELRQKEKQGVQQCPERLRFPVIERILQTDEGEIIVKEMSLLRNLIEKYRGPFCDPDLLHRIKTADLGLLETVHLLEKLMELSGRSNAGVFKKEVF